MEIVYRNLADLKPNPKNPRVVTDEALRKLAKSIEENPKFFEARPILLSDRTGEFVIIAGERRSQAAKILKMDSVPTILMTGLTEEQEDEIMVRDNTHAGKWDAEKLKQWSSDELGDWGCVPADWGGEKKDDKYTRKIESPIYEPKGEMPSVTDLFDTKKRDELVGEIKKSKIPAEIRDFLLLAAERHTVFNYDKIAEFYAHCAADVQRLFERSALVIIDFDDAIGGGYIKLCKTLIEQYETENGDA